MDFKFEVRKDDDRICRFMSLSDAIRFCKFDSMYPENHKCLYKIIDRKRGIYWEFEIKPI